MTFKFQGSVKTDLETDCYADITNNEIEVKRRLEENNNKIVFRQRNGQNLKIEVITPEGKRMYRTSSSSGLSGGAIAAIVIACVVAFIGLALAFIYFNKPVIKPVEANAIDFSNNVNSSVMIM